VRGTHTHLRERKRGAWLREEEGELLGERSTSEQVWIERCRSYLGLTTQVAGWSYSGSYRAEKRGRFLACFCNGGEAELGPSLAARRGVRVVQAKL
jgi:hypothetical protein